MKECKKTFAQTTCQYHYFHPLTKHFKTALFYTHLYTEIEQHNMLSEHQYGFRSGLSTSSVI